MLLANSSVTSACIANKASAAEGKFKSSVLRACEQQAYKRKKKKKVLA